MLPSSGRCGKRADSRPGKSGFQLISFRIAVFAPCPVVSYGVAGVPLPGFPASPGGSASENWDVRIILSLTRFGVVFRLFLRSRLFYTNKKGFIVGIPPDPVPFTNACPLGPWKDGLEPDYITLTLSGFETGTLWTAGEDPPPNGTYNIPFYACGGYSLTVGNFYFLVIVGGSYISIMIEYKGLYPAFNMSGPLEDPSVIENNHDGTNRMYGNGQVESVLYLDGIQLPVEWQPGLLVGVPPADGYFAEQFDSDIADKRTRYSCHHDGTNVKVYTNE